MNKKKYVRSRAVKIMIAVILLWIVIVGVGVAKSFDKVAEGNRRMTQMEWTLLVDTAYDNLKDIRVIEGSDYFIGDGEAESNLIDETGHVIAGPYEKMTVVGDGYVITENTYTGVVIEDEEGNNIRVIKSILDKNGHQLSKEKQAVMWEKYADGEIVGKRVKKDNRNGVGMYDGDGMYNESRTYKIVKYGRILGIAKEEGR